LVTFVTDEARDLTRGEGRFRKWASVFVTIGTYADVISTKEAGLREIEDG